MEEFRTKNPEFASNSAVVEFALDALRASLEDWSADALENLSKKIVGPLIREIAEQERKRRGRDLRSAGETPARRPAKPRGA